jgi:hypothetical protein
LTTSPYLFPMTESQLVWGGAVQLTAVPQNIQVIV